MKKLLQLKEWAEERDSVLVENYQEYNEKEKSNRKLRELQLNGLYNPRYSEEKESYRVNLDALRAYYSIGHPR